LHILFVIFVKIKQVLLCSRISQLSVSYLSQDSAATGPWAMWHGFCCKFLEEYNNEKKFKNRPTFCQIYERMYYIVAQFF